MKQKYVLLLVILSAFLIFAAGCAEMPPEVETTTQSTATNPVLTEAITTETLTTTTITTETVTTTAITTAEPPVILHGYTLTGTTADGCDLYTCRHCGLSYKTPKGEPSHIVCSNADEINFLNFSDSCRSRADCPVEIIVLHFSSAVVLDKTKPYDDALIRGIFEDNEVGTHYILDRNGKIKCWIPEELAAYHAGKGKWTDPKYDNLLNNYSIGIEMYAMGSYDDMSIYLSRKQYDALDPAWIGYTDGQYEALKLLLDDLCARWEIPFDRAHIIAHSDYSKNKKDPGELFDWSRIGL